MTRGWVSALVLAAAAFGPPLAYAEDANANRSDADQLAKQLSNPVAALISVPLQLNYDEGYAVGGERWLLNIQPVVPISVSEDWNLISRTILPVIAQDIGGASESGIGDIVQSLFFSPKKPTASGWIWGVGPAFLLPTASEDVLGAEQWAIGPTAVVLKQTESGWTYGALTNYLVSVAGKNDRADVNALFFQPFLSKALGQGRTVSVNFESTYDFENDALNAPINLMYSKVTKMGGQLLSFAGGVRYYVETPQGGPDWGLRFVVTLLYPK